MAACPASWRSDWTCSSKARRRRQAQSLTVWPAWLTTTFGLWLGALAEKWGVALPSIREYEEVSAVLLEKIDRWGEEILKRGIEQGVEQGIAREKALLRHQAERRFGPAAAERLSAVLAAVTDADRLAEAGEWIVDCATAADFLTRVEGSRS